MLIVPLGKKGSTGFPVLTLFLCVICIIVYVFASAPADRLALAYRPDTLDVLRMFTSVFAHADIWHLVGNLFFFYSFARTVETQISIPGYLLAFVLFVFATNLAYHFTAAQPIPTIGLSGVVWGYMGVFLLRYPKEYVNCFVWFLVYFRTIEIPALVFILAFFAFDAVAYRYVSDSPVNYVAHFSGFAAGIVFKLAFWRLFTTEEPDPGRRPLSTTRPVRR